MNARRPSATSIGQRYRGRVAVSIGDDGDSVVATWYTAPTSDAMTDRDSVAAYSSDRGRTFTLRTIAAGPKWDMEPVAAAWGPDPQGAGLAYQILLAGLQLNVPRLFAALVLITVTGVGLYAAVLALSWLALRRWHESALTRD